MNKGRLIGGLVCVAVAALLAVLMFTLPEGKVVFMIGDSNQPIIPVIVLAGIGVALISSAWQRQGV
ncbi:MAG: hypothetical protein PVH11_09955 [Anaerolineae bacterium]|jgi:uncharacterized membrane protein